MKALFSMIFAVSLICAPAQKAEASDIATSVVVGIVVSQYVGTLAGVAASLVLAGSAIAIHSAGKEAVAQAAQNDIQDFIATGNMSLALENSINGIQAEDESISEEEAIDLILAAVQ